jgi:hypothetical protein
MSSGVGRFQVVARLCRSFLSVLVDLLPRVMLAVVGATLVAGALAMLALVG